MIINYIKMKNKEIKLKLKLYSVIEQFITEKDNIFELINNIYKSLKDIPINDLQSEFISALATVIHDTTHEDK